MSVGDGDTRRGLYGSRKALRGPGKGRVRGEEMVGRGRTKCGAWPSGRRFEGPAPGLCLSRAHPRSSRLGHDVTPSRRPLARTPPEPPPPPPPSPPHTPCRPPPCLRTRAPPTFAASPRPSPLPPTGDLRPPRGGETPCPFQRSHSTWAQVRPPIARLCPSWAQSRYPAVSPSPPLVHRSPPFSHFCPPLRFPHRSISFFRSASPAVVLLLAPGASHLPAFL